MKRLFTFALALSLLAPSIASASASFGGTSRPYKADIDGDGLNTLYERAHACLYPFIADSGNDPDGDGLTSMDEYLLGTNPCDEDSDGDGVNDSEDAYPSDSTRSEEESAEEDFSELHIDTDGDGIPDWYETYLGTDPNNPDSDGDGFSDGFENEKITGETDDETESTERWGDPTDSSVYPNLDLSVLGYENIVAYGSSSSDWTTTSVSYTSSLDLEVDPNGGSDMYVLVEADSEYAMALKWNEEAYLNDVTVLYCGGSSSSFDPGSVGSCSAKTSTSVSAYSSEWTDLDFAWSNTSSSENYFMFKIQF